MSTYVVMYLIADDRGCARHRAQSRDPSSARAAPRLTRTHILYEVSIQEQF